jgi:hypothetical protein
MDGFSNAPQYSANGRDQVALKHTETSTNVVLECFHLYQHSETNGINFSFNLLRIKDLYIFRALLTHPREVPHRRDFVY